MMRISKIAICLMGGLLITPAWAQNTLHEDGSMTLLPRAETFKSVIARSNIVDETVKEFYAERQFIPVWTNNLERRTALLDALRSSHQHGLPQEKYDFEGLELISSLRFGDFEQMATAEMSFTRSFLAYGRHITSGVVVPKEVNWEIQHTPNVIEPGYLMRALVQADNPAVFFSSLAPNRPEYIALMNEREKLSRMIASEQDRQRIPTKGMMRPGYQGKRVSMVRERLNSLGYGDLGTSPVYDLELAAVVEIFQTDNKLTADAVMGPATIGAMNKSASDRLEHVLVNLERQRWMNHDRSGRHLEVNIVDFSMSVIDDEQVTFRSKVVIGKTGRDFRTPEFSKDMTHMVINPFWHVPKSIAQREYLPMLKQDPMALAKRGLWLMNGRGQVLNTEGADFSGFSKGNFPFLIKQPPGGRNALGRVKFMFPNRNNIYLHDTPAKKLFRRDRRAYSHGCVRVEKPFELAYHLLEPQEKDPKGAFHWILNKKRERQVNLKTPVPVHLLYNTAFMAEDGTIAYREDIYKRDRGVFEALLNAGVAVADLSG